MSTMTHRELQTMLKQLSKYQKNQISPTIQRFLALNQELTEIEPDTCPCCGDQNAVFIRKGMLRGKQRFQCKSCGRKFTYDTRQLTSNSHQPMESWIVVLEDTLSLTSLDSTADKIGVCHTTAFRMRHKLRIYSEKAKAYKMKLDAMKRQGQRRDLRGCRKTNELRQPRFECRTYLPIRYSSMPLAATLPAPMAEMTVAAPVTASPPA